MIYPDPEGYISVIEKSQRLLRKLICDATFQDLNFIGKLTFTGSSLIHFYSRFFKQIVNSLFYELFVLYTFTTNWINFFLNHWILFLNYLLFLTLFFFPLEEYFTMLQVRIEESFQLETISNHQLYSKFEGNLKEFVNCITRLVFIRF